MDDYKNVKEVTILVDGKKVHTRLFYCSKTKGLHPMPALASKGKSVSMDYILEVLHETNHN
jgi:hypothetical protein